MKHYDATINELTRKEKPEMTTEHVKTDYFCHIENGQLIRAWGTVFPSITQRNRIKHMIERCAINCAVFFMSKGGDMHGCNKMPNGQWGDPYNLDEVARLYW